jgi:hypothetical protein
LFDRTQPERKVISTDEANERGDPFGLQFDEPITEDALEILIERKRRERIFQSIRERAPRGLFFSPLKLATSFASQAFDPINIASAFVPVTNSIRFLQVAKSSRRLLKGSLEGLAGAAAVEPVVLLAATSEQADYNMYDSLINVAFGAALGGGLHVGAGKAGDFFAKRATARKAANVIADGLEGRDPTVPPPLADRITEANLRDPDVTVSDRATAAQPETRADVGRLAAAQLIDGRPVEVRGTLDLDAGARAPLAPREALDAARDPPTSQVREEIEHQVSKALDDEDRIGVSREEAALAEDTVKDAPDIEDPVEIERLADEAQDDVDTLIDNLDEEGQALKAELDKAIATERAEGVEGATLLRTGAEAAQIVDVAKRKQSFLKQLGDCILRNP